MRTIRNITAFGLLDSIVALALLGLLLFISLPIESEISTSLHLKSEAESLKHAIERAVILARQMESELTLEIAPKNYTVLITNDSKIIEHHELHHSILIEIPAPPTIELSFFPSGVVSPTSIRLKALDGSICDLRLALRGRVTLLCS